MKEDEQKPSEVAARALEAQRKRRRRWRRWERWERSGGGGSQKQAESVGDESGRLRRVIARWRVGAPMSMSHAPVEKGLVSEQTIVEFVVLLTMIRSERKVSSTPELIR